MSTMTLEQVRDWHRKTAREKDICGELRFVGPGESPFYRHPTKESKAHDAMADAIDALLRERESAKVGVTDEDLEALKACCKEHLEIANHYLLGPYLNAGEVHKKHIGFHLALTHAIADLESKNDHERDITKTQVTNEIVRIARDIHVDHDGDTLDAMRATLEAVAPMLSARVPDGWQLVPIPPSNCRQRLMRTGKPYPRSVCQACGQWAPKADECDAQLSVSVIDAAPKRGEG